MEWNLQSSERKNCQSRTLYAAKIFSKTNGEIKALSDKKKMREFVASIPEV